MTVDDIRYLEAIARVYREVSEPRSRRWMTEEGQAEICRRVQAALPLPTGFREKVFELWDNFGKRDKEGQKHGELLVQVVLASGARCFWQGRVAGNCSGELELDRLVPGVWGGRYIAGNCILACSFHNNQRNGRSLDEYLRTYGPVRDESCQLTPP